MSKKPQFRTRIADAESQLRRNAAQRRLEAARSELTLNDPKKIVTEDDRLRITRRIAEAERDIAIEDRRDKAKRRAAKYRREAKKDPLTQALDFVAGIFK